MGKTNRVVIGMDPHKRSATIEAMAEDESVLGKGRYGTDRAGFDARRRRAVAGSSVGGRGL
jgi:transposase